MRDISYHYIVEPTQAPLSSGSSTTRVQQIIFEQDMEDFVKEKRYHKMLMAEMSNVIHGQCTNEFINQMRTYLEYKTANDESNVNFLLWRSSARSVIDMIAKCTSPRQSYSH